MKQAVGCDGGLMTSGFAHVMHSPSAESRIGFTLLDAQLYVASPVEAPTVAEQIAELSIPLHRWWSERIAAAVAIGAEAVFAERYEHVRDSSSAAKYSAGHAALTLACANLDPRPSAQRFGSGAPEYASARRIKKALVGCDAATKRVVIAAAKRTVAGVAERLKGMRVEDQAHVADAIAAALYGLGHVSKPIVLGEAPSVFEAMFGARLAALIGKKPSPKCSLCKGSGICSEVKEVGPGIEERGVPAACFCTQGKATIGDVFELMKSSDPRLLAPCFAGRAVIFSGTRVASAFGLDFDEELSWREIKTKEAAYMAALLPHPSGVNRWWNDAKNEARARTFLRAAARVS